MKTTDSFLFQKFTYLLVALAMLLNIQAFASVQNSNQQKEQYNQYSGIVTDHQSGKPLIFASLSVIDTNISTITNTEGEFLLKIPKSITNAKVQISFLGYQKKIMPIADFKRKNTRITLYESTIKLSEINVTMPKDAKALVRLTLSKKGVNNMNEKVLMTAFYRETIKKRRKNVSLAEAIVNIYKEPYLSSKRDRIKLFKARKKTDYSKLDTLALKLQGGPFNALFVDLMKYPEYIFTDDAIDFYNFSFAPSTTINERPVYVVKFSQVSDIEDPLYYGKLFIDSQTLALTSAIYSLNVKNKELASGLFVRKKPKDVKVYPTVAAYRVDYREKNGKWHYGYSNVQLSFTINKKRKWFNKIYSLTSEMAVTDWKINKTDKLKSKDRLRTSIIIADEASGFSDPEFWGAFNVIEPEKSIESAINKIRRQLKKANKG
jgi:hypothetical protein